MGRDIGRPIFISIAESCRVNETERACFVQQEVEDGPSIKHSHLVQITMPRLEFSYVCSELGIVISKGRSNFFHRTVALLDQQRSAVGGRDGKEEERPGAAFIEYLNLYNQRGLLIRSRKGQAGIRYRPGRTVFPSGHGGSHSVR